MITVRLDPKLEQTINNIARQMGISKSELIRKSVTEFIEKTDKPSPWELGQGLFGTLFLHENVQTEAVSIHFEHFVANRGHFYSEFGH